jgi:hypothetical protein
MTQLETLLSEMRAKREGAANTDKLKAAAAMCAGDVHELVLQYFPELDEQDHKLHEFNLQAAEMIFQRLENVRQACNNSARLENIIRVAVDNIKAIALCETPNTETTSELMQDNYIEKWAMAVNLMRKTLAEMERIAGEVK